MMRHFFVPGPVAAGSLRVRAPSSIAGLVARAGRPLASLTGERPAVTGAVNLATVTAATDQRLGTAFRAKEQARRRGIHVGAMKAAWISAAFGVILPPHACPARCEGTASSRTAKFDIGAVPVLRKEGTLPGHPPMRQAATTRGGSIISSKLEPRDRSGPEWGQITSAPDRRGFRPPSTRGAIPALLCGLGYLGDRDSGGSGGD